jgi:tRNA(Ile)-lysidine synthase
MSPRPEPFGARWLGRRLASLLPEYPRVRLCVAFSGGADSTALLAALAQQRRRPSALRAVHVDHGLHPDSPRWAKRAASAARALGVRCATLRASAPRTPGESPEARARAARYAALAAQLAEGEVLLTAHHQDDQLETVLLMLLRGAGVAGLAAMPEVTAFAGGSLARPLLTCTRTQLLAFIERERLAHLEDPSNLDEHLDRNYLRRCVLPVILERWPGAATTVSRVARHAAEAQQLLERQARSDLAAAWHGAALAASALRALPPPRRRNALRFWIAARGVTVPPAARLEEIAGPLLEARADARPAVEWAGARLEREAGLIRLRAASGGAPGAAPAAASELRWSWGKRPVCPLPADLGQLELRADPQGPLDLSRLAPSLTVRWRRGGERLRPGAGRPRRALKSLLQEARVPLGQRQRLPLLFSGARLVAVADLWLDASVQAGATARRRARLVWTGA